MSRKLETSVYSLDGNSIWEVALKFERLGLQEINKFPETVFQGQDLINARDTFNYKTQFDKLFTLIKEFYVKINGTQNMYNSIFEEIDEAFMKVLINERNNSTVKTSKATWTKDFKQKLDVFKLGDNIEDLYNKIGLVVSRNDTAIMKYAKLEMIPDLLNTVYQYIEANEDTIEFMNILREYRDDDGDGFITALRKVEQEYEVISEQLKNEVILGLKETPELRNRLDIRSTLRLSRYEGSASNVLRDVLITSNNMIHDMNNKRVALQESIRQDERIVSNIKKDNTLIGKYLKELSEMEEVEKNYLESFDKVVENMGKINTFVKEL
jgi:hypothetical protein